MVPNSKGASMKVAVIVFALVASSTATSGQERVSGWLTDTQCGARGANENHAVHARRMVASGKAKYAIYDEATKKLYILEPQSAAEQWLGQRVSISGTVSAANITRAGESHAPDAVAHYNGANGTKRPTAETDIPDGKAVATTARTQRHGFPRPPLDTSTPVAGVLTITKIESAPR